MASCQRIPRQRLPLLLCEELAVEEARSNSRGGIQDASGGTDTLVAMKKRNINMHLDEESARHGLFSWCECAQDKSQRHILW